MPELCYHAYFATLVKNELEFKREDLINKFYQGNFIPDMFDKAGKNRTHMYIPYSYGFEVPDIDKIYNICKDHLDNPIVFGIYSHLYLDTRYIKEYLVSAFKWDMENGIIINPKNGKSFTKNEFFGSKNTGLYLAYTSINPFLIKDCNLDMNSISETLEMSGIDIFDVGRREKTWKEELKYYLSQDVKYTGDVLDYNELTEKIKMFAKDFVNGR